MDKIFKNLFKTRKDGKIQTIWVELEGDHYRSHSSLWDNGVIESSHIISEWRYAEITNEGRSNQRTAEEQAEFEVNRNYRIRLEQGYTYEIGGEVQRKDQIKPMLADKFNNRIDCSNVYTQAKLDGLRCIATVDGLFTRNWKPIVSAPHIYEALLPYLEEGYIFDGELYNHDLKDDFNKIISLGRKTKPTLEDILESKEKLQYWIFDLILDGMKFKDRYDELKNLNIDNYSIKIVKTDFCKNKDELDEKYHEYLSDGFEGQMIRRNTNYEYVRTKNLIKRKDFIDEEFVIEKFNKGNGNWSKYFKTIDCYDPINDIRFCATIKGSREFCEYLEENEDKYIGNEVTVRFQNRSPWNEEILNINKDFRNEMDYDISWIVGYTPRFPIAVNFYQGKRIDFE